MGRRVWRWLARLYALIFATPLMAGFHYLLLSLALRGLGILNYFDAAVSGEHYLIARVLPRLIINSQPILFDVGANRGDYARQLSINFPDAKILAFEPHPKNYQVLAALQLRGVSSFEMALGDTAGVVNLFDRSDDDGSTNASIYEGVINEIHQATSVVYEIKMETLATITKSHKIEYIDFLKIDAEGNELAILRGGKELLDRNRIGVIQFEFNTMNIISRSWLHDFRMLLGANYDLYRLLPHGLLLIPEPPLLSELFAYQNILAISKQIAYHA